MPEDTDLKKDDTDKKIIRELEFTANKSLEPGAVNIEIAEDPLLDDIASNKIDPDRDIEKDGILSAATRLLTEENPYPPGFSEIEQMGSVELARRCYISFESLLDKHDVTDKDGTLKLPSGQLVSFAKRENTLKIMTAYKNAQQGVRYQDQYWLTPEGDASYETTTFEMRKGAKDEEIIDTKIGHVWGNDKEIGEDILRHGLQELIYTITEAASPKTQVIKYPEKAQEV